MSKRRLALLLGMGWYAQLTATDLLPRWWAWLLAVGVGILWPLEDHEPQPTNER